MTWQRFVAVGDSFTEGVGDPGPGDALVGWADRLAALLSAAQSGVEYANLAVRGRLLGQVVDEQVPVALALRPDLVSIVAGGNDLLRPGADPDALAAVMEEAVVALRATGADVLLATGVDPRATPLIGRTRGRSATYNAHLWSIAARHGAHVLDQWGAAWVQDARMWDVDRLHLAPEGHRRTALAAAAALGLDVDPSWAVPLDPAPQLPRRERVAGELAWVRSFVVPWVGRRLRGRSSGDGRTAKRPVPTPV
ncbi:SGNH/GDSL hydrolase family protein [Klenkia sp. LSe6-5]|uniref:SGNH/GDSL hydrolase family protein n=1 Tax=Klenkia sesuvii TaxID=3103137 RepID=A0ABU8DZJ6_9ACTN